jgi:hypothetical protein
MKELYNDVKSRFPVRARQILAGMLFFACSICQGQAVISGGAIMTVLPETVMNSGAPVTLQEGGSVNNQGTMILTSDLVNSNAGVNSLGIGLVQFSGTIPQSISGQFVINDLSVNNATGLSVNGNTRVNRVFTLTSGLVSLGSHNLLLGPTATIAGSPSAANMVVATSTGQLQKEFASIGSFTYPVGDASGTAEYSPVLLQFNSGTFASGNNAGVNLVNGQYPGTATSYLRRYWNVAQSGITAYSCNATFQYVPADVSGTESNIFCFRVDPSLPWTAYNASNTVAHQVTAHGLSSLGTYTGNLGNGAVPPLIRSLQDKTIQGAMVTCADAQQTLLIAGNGTSYLVEPGGSATHLAGQNILYEPGTMVNQGGYLHGNISGTYCNPYIQPIAAGSAEPAATAPRINRLFAIYPNPTTGQFTLELKSDSVSAPVHLEICGILGEKLLVADRIMQKQEFSLSGKPAGVYLVHATSGSLSETVKIIKQ